MITNKTDAFRKIPEALKLQERISLISVSVLFVAGYLIWMAFYCLKIPVKQFAHHCSDFFLIEID